MFCPRALQRDTGDDGTDATWLYCNEELVVDDATVSDPASSANTKFGDLTPPSHNDGAELSRTRKNSASVTMSGRNGYFSLVVNGRGFAGCKHLIYSLDAHAGEHTAWAGDNAAVITGNAGWSNCADAWNDVTEVNVDDVECGDDGDDEDDDYANDPWGDGVPFPGGVTDFFCN
jgi:hypothetical protein